MNSFWGAPRKSHYPIENRRIAAYTNRTPRIITWCFVTSFFRNLIIGGVVLTLAPYAAQAGPSPRVTGSLSVEIQNDNTFHADDLSEERNELGTLTEASVSVLLAKGLSINTGLTFEAVTDPRPSEDRVFQDHGLYVEVATLSYETDRFSLYAGKFGPNFSIAFDAAAGVYGTDMSEDDVELAEFVGFGGSYTIGQTALGSLTASASLFTADRSALSNSIFTKRGRTSLDDAGPGNTRGLKSFAVALDGDSIKGLDGLRYHIGFAKLGTEGGLAERRLAIAAEWAIATAAGVTVTPLLEYVRFWQAGGNAGENRHYYTVSLMTEYRRWNIALAYTGRTARQAAPQPMALSLSNSRQFQVSAGYSFTDNLSLDIGYKVAREGGSTSKTAGALLAYGLAF